MTNWSITKKKKKNLSIKLTSLEKKINEVAKLQKKVKVDVKLKVKEKRYKEKAKNLNELVQGVKRKKISTLNSKFTLYFILIALTPSVLLGIIGLVLINFGINDWFNSKINNVIKISDRILNSARF